MATIYSSYNQPAFTQWRASFQGLRQCIVEFYVQYLAAGEKMLVTQNIVTHAGIYNGSSTTGMVEDIVYAVA
eukprot:scaffold161205_cov35-Attheya_sp.AAC.1